MVRNISSRLRPSGLDHFGWFPCPSLAEEIERQSGIRIEVHSREMAERFSPEKELAIYRIIQEVSNQCSKTFRGHEVFVTLICRGDTIQLSVEDDGKGFDYDEFDKDSFLQHLGISIMGERALQFSGKFRIESKPGKGTLVIVEIPVG